MLTFIEAQVRGGLVEKMTGLYAGQPSRQTDSPTGVLLLKAFSHTDAYQHGW
jgi:hypothetical protein